MLSQYLNVKIHYKGEEKELALLRFLCHIAKNIYNSSLYYQKQYYFEKKKLLKEEEVLEKLKSNVNSSILLEYQVREIVKNATMAMRRYDVELNKVKYNDFFEKSDQEERVFCPKYKNKNDFFQLVIKEIRNVKNKYETINLPLAEIVSSNQIFNNKLKDELVQEFVNEYGYDSATNISIKIPDILVGKRLLSCKILPEFNGNYFELSFLYKANYKPVKKEIKKYMAIDLGITNLATCITSDNEGFIIDGKILKSKLRLFSKIEARLKRNIDNDIDVDKEYNALRVARKNYVSNYINKACATLFDEIKKKNVDMIIYGLNDNFKNGSINENERGFAIRKANQMFSQMPIIRFINCLETKAKKEGIRIDRIDEAYTSLASFYDNDLFDRKEFSGERIKRGLYKTKDGKLVNADINAALNIYMKYVMAHKIINNKLIYLKNNGIIVPRRLKVKR